MEVTIENLRKKFDIHRPNSFELNIPRLTLIRGEVLYVMGHNGSGKSVMSKVISGEMAPTSGCLNFSAKDLSISMVRQNADQNLALNLTVAENLFLHQRKISFKKKLFPRQHCLVFAKKVLNEHQTLGSKLDDLVSDLSGGQRQALAFFVCTSKEPDILVLDEFLASTDERTKKMLSKEIQNYKEYGKSILVVSHDIPLAIQQADRIIVLKSGEVLDDFRKDTDMEKWKKSYLEEILVS